MASKLKGKMGDDAVTEKDNEMIITAFRNMDLNGDGKISVSELCRACKKINMSLSYDDARKLLQEVDANGDGYLDFDEFSNMMKELIKEKRTEDQYLRHIFTSMDKNEDGYICKDELVSCMNLPESEAVELIREADTDNDGRINFEEFVAGYKGTHD